MILYPTDVQMLLTIGKIGGILSADLQTMWAEGLSQSSAQRSVAKLRKLKLIQSTQAHHGRYYGQMHYITRKGVAFLQDAYPHLGITEEKCNLPRLLTSLIPLDLFLSKALTSFMYSAPSDQYYAGMDIRREYEPRKAEGSRQPHFNAFVTMYRGPDREDYIDHFENREKQWMPELVPPKFQKVHYAFMVDREYIGNTITAYGQWLREFFQIGRRYGISIIPLICWITEKDPEEFPYFARDWRRGYRGSVADRIGKKDVFEAAPIVIATWEDIQKYGSGGEIWHFYDFQDVDWEHELPTGQMTELFNLFTAPVKY